MTNPTRAPRLIAVLAAILVALVVPPGSAAASQFPAGYQAFHTYAELTADVAATAAAHPDIVSRFSIGKSYQGRDIWAVKISDNVTVDENEPEVLYDGGTHSDEHMGVEMTLHIMHWLVNGYGTDPRITNIVNNREIYIVFEVNPDGNEYDISGGRFHFWRKNRQPTPHTTAIGTDLNRNFGYRWGLEGNTSTNPRAITYRGPRAFSAPETRAMRDFLASRVVNGRQQIRTAITFHEAGRLVMWPYGYSYVDIPPDMTRDDHAALVVIGRHMASTNGYRAEQASDLYLTSGTTRDFEYGMYRIFSYTFEMSNRDYPNQSWIAPETGRNKEAVLYLAERAGCPLSILGPVVRAARCGAFDDDLEVARGWVVNPDGTDTATSGAFSRAHPYATSASGPKQLAIVPSGVKAFVTGAVAGLSPNANDLDGVTTVRSTGVDLPVALGQKLTFRYVFAHDGHSSVADRFAAIIEDSTGTQTTVFLRTGAPSDLDGVWRAASVSLDQWAGTTIHIRFQAADGGPNNLVEVEVDDVRVTKPS